MRFVYSFSHFIQYIVKNEIKYFNIFEHILQKKKYFLNINSFRLEEIRSCTMLLDDEHVNYKFFEIFDLFLNSLYVIF